MPVTVPTFAELYDAAQSEITARQPTLTDFSEGSNLDAVAGAAAVVADEAIRHGIMLARAGFIETAEAGDLDALVTSRGGPVRKPLTAATTTFVVTRTSYVGAYTFSAGLTVSGYGADGSPVSFNLTTTKTLGAMQSSVSLSATCNESGPNGNVPAGSVTTISGLPAGLTVTQPNRAAGGAAEETDDAYRARYRLGLRARARGTPAALEYAALSVAGVAFAAVNEDAIAGDTGYVALYIADSTGTGSSDLATAVTTALDTIDIDGTPGVRAAGALVQVLAAAREEIALAYTVKVKPGSGVTENDVKAAVLAFTNALPPSRTLWPSAAEAAILQIGSDVLDAQQTLPATAYPPTLAYNSIRTASDGSDVSVTIVEASP